MLSMSFEHSLAHEVAVILPIKLAVIAAIRKNGGEE